MSCSRLLGFRIEPGSDEDVVVVVPVPIGSAAIDLGGGDAESAARWSMICCGDRAVEVMDLRTNHRGGYRPGRSPRPSSRSCSCSCCMVFLRSLLSSGTHHGAFHSCCAFTRCRPHPPRPACIWCPIPLVAIPDRLTPATDGSFEQLLGHPDREVPHRRLRSRSLARWHRPFPVDWRPGTGLIPIGDRSSPDGRVISGNRLPAVFGSIGNLAHVGHRACVVQDGEVSAGPLLGDVEAVCSAPQRLSGGACHDGPEFVGPLSRAITVPSGSEDDRIGVPESRRRMVSGDAQHAVLP